MLRRAAIPFFSSAVVLWLLFLFFPQVIRCENALLLQGIELYRQENYSASAKVLEQARQEEPGSSSAAFFLGLAYKQLMDYQKALPHFRDAVTLTPRIKEALIELIEVLYQLYEGGKLEEAKKWIEVAEREDIFPSKVAFLKGLIFAKEGKYAAAADAFEKSKTLDSSLSQSADVQIALCHMNEREFSKARDRLLAAVQQDPTSDLASFARQYQDLVQKRIEMEKPLRLTLSAFGQYDTNVVLKPIEGSLAPDIIHEDSRVLTSHLRLDYLPLLEGPWLFNAQVALGSSLHQRYSTSHDAFTDGIYLAPGYNFGTSAINLALRYDHALVRNPSYKKYVGCISAGPLYRRLLMENQILEFFAGLARADYAIPPLIPEEDRDSDRINTYVSWVWLFKKDAFLNLKIEFSSEDTEGSNWVNKGLDFAAALTLPLTEDLSLQVSGELFQQDFRNVHTIFNVKRQEDTFSGTVGLVYRVFKNLNLILQYSYTRADSNLAIYDYDRSVYSAGMEYRY